MTRQRLADLYFEWLCDLVDANYYDEYSYTKLMRHLFQRPFDYILDRDSNRYEDGINMRYLFGSYREISQSTIASYLDDADCSMLEMMVALAMRCESIMSDPDNYGDQTASWFWEMIESIGLDMYDDDNFDIEEVDRLIDICLNRTYEPDGSGGFFTLYDPPGDMRDVEIWVQMSWYLNYICRKRGII